jgi:hypothetical protein
MSFDVEWCIITDVSREPISFILSAKLEDTVMICDVGLCQLKCKILDDLGFFSFYF